MKYMKPEQEPVDLTKPVLELLRGIDFAFDQKDREPTTPQLEQQRYAAALAAIGRFLTKIAPTHADRLFVLSDALADYSIGAHPPLLRRLKRRSAPNPTQIEAAKANVAFALDALIALGEPPKNAANKLLVRFPGIKALAGPKSRKVGSWEKTILEWRKSLSAPSRTKNELAAEIFKAGHALIDFYIKTNRRADLKRHALGRAKHATSVGVFRPVPYTLTYRVLSPAPALARARSPGLSRPMVARSYMDARIADAERERRARQRALSIREFSLVYGAGRTRVYEELKSGRLRGRKVGRRTIITQDDAEDWLRRLPLIETAR